jgi:hypothetical protein
MVSPLSYPRVPRAVSQRTHRPSCEIGHCLHLVTKLLMSGAVPPLSIRLYIVDFNSKLSGYFIYQNKSNILPTQCIYVFCT